MITTVTLNPAIDRTIVLEDFTVGSVNRAKSVREDMGGKGINVAKVLNSLGADTTAIGFMGQGNIESVRLLLKNENLKSDFIMVDGYTRTNMKIIETSTKTTTDVNEAGFHVGMDHVDVVKALIRAYAKKSEYVVFSGSMPTGVSPGLYGELMESISGDTRCVLDAEGKMLLEGLKGRPFIIKPNLFELETALNVSLDSKEKIVDAARGLIEKYGIGYVLLSMGGDGSILISAREAYQAGAVKVDVKGTVGAGDSMLAGFLYGLSLERGPQAALAWATSCGALAVSKEGTQTFRKADVEGLLSKVQIERLG